MHTRPGPLHRSSLLVRLESPALSVVSHDSRHRCRGLHHHVVFRRRGPATSAYRFIAIPLSERTIGDRTCLVLMRQAAKRDVGIPAASSLVEDRGFKPRTFRLQTGCSIE